MHISAYRKQADSSEKEFWMKRLVGSLVLMILFAAAGQAQSEVAVVNGASFRAGFPVSPGSLASAFGSFGTVTQGGAPALPLGTELNGVQVFVNDVAAPLLFVSEGQINFQVPASMPGRVPIRVVNAGTVVAEGTVDIIQSAPGLFHVTTDPQKQGAALNQDFSANGEQRPAIRGQVIQLFGTGQGPLSSPIPDGEGAPSDNPARTTSMPQVFVSVDEAEVLFSGMAPGFVGLWQINVRIPDQSYIAGQVPVFVVKDGIESNQISVWVAQ